MAGKPLMGREQRVENPPPEVAHVVRGLDRFIEARRERHVPEEGYNPAEVFHLCVPGCILHDHDE